MTNSYQSLAARYDAQMARSFDRAAWHAFVWERLCGALGHPPATACDAACGTGAVAIELARRGCKTAAFDACPEMLEQAQANARTAGVRLPFSQQGLTDFALHHPVEAITCICDGANYLLTPAALAAFFARAAQHLVPGGVLHFDLSSPHKLQHLLGNTTSGAAEADWAMVWENAYDADKALLEMNLTLFDLHPDGSYTRAHERHLQAAHAPERVLPLLRDAGFTTVDLRGDDRLSPPTDTCLRHHYTCTKGAC